MELLTSLLAGVAAASLLGSVILLRLHGHGERDRLRRLGSERTDDILDRSLRERVILPLLHRAVAVPATLLPPRLVANIEGRMVAAGIAITLRAFLGAWALFAIAAAGVLALVAARSGMAGIGLGLAVLAGLGAGLIVPWYWLARRMRGRIKRIDRTLPDAIDFIVTSVEAGVGLQGAMLNMSRKFDGPISEEFLRVVRETALGRSREAALEAMAQRCRSQGLSLFVSAIVHAEQTGIPIARVLRRQALELRERRRMRAREEANKIPARMTIPTVAFVFPTMFLLILGPVALRAIEVFQA